MDRVSSNNKSFSGWNIEICSWNLPFRWAAFWTFLFFRISKSFPYLKKFTLINEKAQNEKQCGQFDGNGENEHLSIREYPYLSVLNLTEAHDDYLEEFLLHTNTSLSNHLYLSVDYQRLKRVTQGFRRNATRKNCQKLGSLGLIGINRVPLHVKEYFPQTNIV